MESIKTSKGKAVLTFSRLYKEEAIRQAVADFSSLGRIVQRAPFTVEIEAADARRIALELQNYVLGVMKNEGLV